MEFSKQEMDEALVKLVGQGTVAAFVDSNGELRFVHSEYVHADGNGWDAGGQRVADEDMLSADEVQAMLYEDYQP